MTRYEEARHLQETLAGKVSIQPFPLRPALVLGMDLAFSPDGQWAFAAGALFRYPGLDVVETAAVKEPVTFPYVPGLLSLRELPALQVLFECFSLKPDLLLIDGQGLAHPRRFGLACHTGFTLDLPAIGCAKSRFIGTFEEPAQTRGSWSWLMDREERIGLVLRTKDGVQPLFISPGHKVDFESARDWVLALGRSYRLPEPTRLADKLAAQAKRQMTNDE